MSLRWDGKNDDVGFEDDAWADEPVMEADPVPKSGDKAIADNTTAPIKNGRYRLEIVEVEKPASKLVYCHVNGEDLSYNARQVKIKFTLVDEPGSHVTFTFNLPPKTEDNTELDAATLLQCYTAGVSSTPYKDKETGEDKFTIGKAVGWHANVMKALFSRLGFEGADGRLVPEAFSPRNWRAYPDGLPRVVIGSVRNEEGNDKKMYPRLEWFGWEKDPETFRTPAQWRASPAGPRTVAKPIPSQVPVAAPMKPAAPVATADNPFPEGRPGRSVPRPEPAAAPARRAPAPAAKQTAVAAVEAGKYDDV